METFRTPEVMKELFRFTKLGDSYSCGVMQAVKCTSSMASDDFKLFELPNYLANEVLKPGSHRVIELKDEPKQNGSGHVYACTNHTTFSLIEVETSNSLLLSSKWWLPCNSPNESVSVTPIEALKSSYYEFQPCTAPSLRQLKQLLVSSTYYGPVEDESDSEETSNSKSTYFTFPLIEARLPCSKHELFKAFDRLRICEIKGIVRLLDVEYITQLVRDIFSLADENSWDWRISGFPLQECIENLIDSHLPHVVRQIFALFFAKKSHQNCSGSQELYVFPRNSKICQIIGEHLLAVTNSFDLIDFLNLWKASVPSGLKPKLHRHLTCAGRAYCQPVETTTHVKPEYSNTQCRYRFRSISLLRSEDLPDDNVDSRLNALFERSNAWPEAELASYVEELVPSSDLNKLSQPGRIINAEKFNLVDCLSEVPYIECDSDFDYEDTISDPSDINSVSEDKPKSISSTIGALLNKHCRVSTNSYGRIYTQKHFKW